MVAARAGKTVKVSVSLSKEDLATLRRHAKAEHQGNLSAAFAEAARLLRQRAARRRLLDELGGPALTLASAAAIDAEQEGRRPPTKPRTRTAA